MRTIFVGPNGVRAGWRFLAYAAMLVLLNQAFQAFLIPRLVVALRLPEGLTAFGFLVFEIVEGVTVLVPTAILAALEHERIDAYGLPFGWHSANAFGKVLGSA